MKNKRFVESIQILTRKVAFVFVPSSVLVLSGRHLVAHQSRNIPLLRPLQFLQMTKKKKKKKKIEFLVCSVPIDKKTKLTPGRHDMENKAKTTST